MATNMDEEQSLRECEAYVQMHGAFFATTNYIENSPSLKQCMDGFFNPNKPSEMDALSGSGIHNI